MMAGLDIEGIDWSDPDVSKLVDVRCEKFRRLCCELVVLQKGVTKLRDENMQLKEEIETLIKKIEGKKSRVRRSRSR